MHKPVWFPAGDCGLLLDLNGYSGQTDQGDSAARAALTKKARVMGQIIAEKSAHEQIKGITDIVPGLASLLIHYDPLETKAAHLKSALSLLLDQTIITSDAKARLWTLPVLYGEEGGPDLPEVATRTGLTPDQVIGYHTATRLEVAIMGFLPGLGYMTGLDQRLFLPRRAEPRTHVRRGSVAIAMDQSLVYPLDSPGGWNLIGMMPVPLFNQAWREPILLRAGDYVSFIAIDADQYYDLCQQCDAGQMPLTPYEISAG